jgi:mono/diheme cytochrome c family protein
MRKFALVPVGLAAIILAWLFVGTPSRSVDMVSVTGDATRGAYVVRLAGCVSCHTAPKTKAAPQGGPFLAGGSKLATPFGIFYGPNITPHREAGIGTWNGDEFADALVNGHSPTGHLYPVFPFTSYSKMTDQDIVDLWAWLKTVPGDATPSRAHEISNPFAARALMAPWKTLFHDVEPFETRADRSPAWNRGRYIVDGIGHCAECHTPRGRFGALDPGRSLEGSTLAPKSEKVPAITAEALAKRDYGKGDLLMAFQFGLVPDGDVLGGSMGEVLSDQLGHLTMQDLGAIATYLLDED